MHFVTPGYPMHSILRWRLLVVTALVLLCSSNVLTAKEPLSASDRRAVGEFRLNRLFAMLGYLEQRATNEAFPWKEVGFSEAGNAWTGLNEEGSKLAAPVREIAAQHEAEHRTGVLGEIGRLFAGSLEGEGVKALAKVELQHALADVQKVNRLLANEPPPTAGELALLRDQELGLLKKFKPHIPGLVAVNGGFAGGGSYRSRQYGDPSKTPYLCEVATLASKPSESFPSKDHGPSPRDKALAEAREAMARARTLADFLASSRKKLTEQLDEAREPLKEGQGAIAVLDAAMKQLSGLALSSTAVNQELQALQGASARLEEAHIKFAELGREYAENATTICNYAEKAEKTPAKQVQTWKADANKTIHQMSRQIESSQTAIDEARAEIVRRRSLLVTAVAKLNAYDALTLALPLISTLEEAQTKLRAALRKAEATGQEMHAAYREIQQLREHVMRTLLSYNDEESNRLILEAKQMDMNIIEPQSSIEQVRSSVLGSSGAPALATLSAARYATLEDALRRVDIDQTVALAKGATEEAESVETVGQSKRAPAYQALKQALECYAKIKGGTSSPGSTAAPPTANTPANSDESSQMLRATGGWKDLSAELTDAYIRFYIEPGKKNFYVMLSAHKYPFPPPPVAGNAYASFAKRSFQASCNAPYDGSATSGRLHGVVKGKMGQDFEYSATGDHTKTELKREVIGEVSFQIDATLKDGRVKGTAVGGGQTYTFDVQADKVK